MIIKNKEGSFSVSVSVSVTEPVSEDTETETLKNDEKDVEEVAN